jgi:alpha-glucosidase
MRVHNDYAQGWNVEQQSKDPNSVWRFWQKMLGLRKQYEALIYGTMHKPAIHLAFVH